MVSVFTITNERQGQGLAAQALASAKFIVVKPGGTEEPTRHLRIDQQITD